MAAELIPALAPQQCHLLRLPEAADGASALQETLYALGGQDLQGSVVLDAGGWLLRLPDLRSLQQRLQRHRLQLERVRAQHPETLVAAAALGLETETTPTSPPPSSPQAANSSDNKLTIHRGTLRSGDHLQSQGSVLLLGDLNPGARISAGGHVLVWGRLRGVAHAGVSGDRTARIVALHLRPLQLRIADAVARGPADAPADGQAEEAQLVNGEIQIEPAHPGWPLPD